MRPQPSYKPGDRIGGQYLVHQALAGGMGEVFLCLDLQSGNPFALKTFQRRYDAPGLKESFFEEVEHWIKLEKHPNIVRCHAMDMVDNRPFMFLEWVAGDKTRGTSLREWLRLGKLDDRTALDFVIDILRGLKHAGEKSPGMVHRDLKPENILIGQNRIAQITDFGLATIGARTEIISEEGDETDDLRHSMSLKGGIAGTPLYMAPEQWRGEQNLDARTDLYAVGCILYEALTARFVYNEKTWSALGEAHCYGALPAWDSIDWAANFLERCLAKTRMERFAMVAEALTALEALYYTRIGEQPHALTATSFMEAFDLSHRGNTYTSLRRYEEALVDHTRAIQLNPTIAGFYTNRGNTYLAMNRYEEATGDYSQAIQLDANDARIFNNRGLAYADQRQYERALSDYSRAIQLDANYAYAYNNRGIIHTDLKRYEEALIDYTEAIRLDANYAQAYFNRGNAYTRLDRTEEALDDYSRALKLDPYLAEVYVGRGLCHAKLGQLDEALSDYSNAIRLKPEDAQAYYERGSIYTKLGRIEEALNDYSQAIQLDPDDLHTYYHLANTHRSMRQYEKALRIYTKAIELDPNFAQAYYNRGLTFHDLGRSEEAQADFTQSIHYDPNFAPAYSNRGDIYAKQGRQDDALSDFECAIQLDPKYAPAYYNRGVVYARQGRQDDALSDFSQAIKLDPSFAQAYYNRGTTFNKLGQISEALNDYSQAIQLDPTYVKAHFNLGALLVNEGHEGEALPFLARAAMLGVQQASQYIVVICQQLGIRWSSDPMGQALNCFQLVESAEAMSRLMKLLYPFMAEAEFIAGMEDFINTQVTPAHRQAFQQRLGWLKQIASA